MCLVSLLAPDQPGNIQHPTSNAQHPMPAPVVPVGSWMLDVGCWMFPRFVRRECSHQVLPIPIHGQLQPGLDAMGGSEAEEPLGFADVRQ